MINENYIIKLLVYEQLCKNLNRSIEEELILKYEKMLKMLNGK